MLDIQRSSDYSTKPSKILVSHRLADGCWFGVLPPRGGAIPSLRYRFSAIDLRRAWI